MKKTLLFVLTFIAIQAGATTWEIEVGGVGGSNNNPPYYDPQVLVIMAGDVVEWNWVGSNHNVTSTSGPESFSSGTHNSGFMFSFTFELPGTYGFECTVADHSDTQFGVITVTPVSVDEINAQTSPDFTFYPSPATDMLTIEKLNQVNASLKVLDLTGKTVREEGSVATPSIRIDVADLPRGIYFIEMNHNGVLVRKKLMLK